MKIVLVLFFAFICGDLAATTTTTETYHQIAPNVAFDEYFCWDTCQKDVCTPVCAPPAPGQTKSATCNSHGACSAETISCTCDPNYAGRWCQHCADGWESTEKGEKFACTVCSENYFPKDKCNIYCDGKACGENSFKNCSDQGKCNCKPGYVGAKCDRCDFDNDYHEYTDANKKVTCVPNKCGPYGYAISYYEGGDDVTLPGTPCVCGKPYVYDSMNKSCNKCFNDTFTLPLCGPEAFANKVGMAPCKPYSLLLPVLLAVGFTLLIIMIIVALFFWCTAKKGPSHSKGDVDMDEPLDSHRDTTYQRL